MINDIPILEQIQVIDSQIYKYQIVALETPIQIQALEADLESERTQLKALESEFKTIQLKQKQKEGDLASKEGSIQKYEVQLTQVKTNKEYSLLQTEISTIKADNSLLEEEIIKLMDQVAECQQRIKTEQQRVQEAEKEVQSKKTVLEAQITEAKKVIGELSVQKKELIKQIDPEVASLYERIIVKKKGVALVKVEGEVCPACQMQLRPQLLNEIKMRDKVVICEQCSRMLYSV